MTTDGEGRDLPARSLSEGTLRFLALCVLLEDSDMTGVITMEEPENGIHPANLQQVVTLIRDLAVDPTSPPGPDNPLRQVIVNTHSPAVVQIVGPDDLLMARANPMIISGHRMRALSVEGFAGTWRSPLNQGVTRADLLPYLDKPLGAQLALFDDVA
jgi:predicted ATPase